MKNNILLIMPPTLPLDEIYSRAKINNSEGLLVSMPMGILSIASYVRSKTSANIFIVDLNIDLIDDMREGMFDYEKIVNEKICSCMGSLIPAIVGISGIFNTSYMHLEVISKVTRGMYPDSIIVAGGGLPSNLPDKVLDFAACIDAICFGEGEIPVLELLDAPDRNDFLDMNPSWITRGKIKNKHLPIPKYIENLDEIPPFDFNIINLGDYQKITRSHGVRSKNVISFMSTRGCLFNCCFCTTGTIHGKKVRSMSPERVLEDINRYVSEYNVDTIIFEDDHFLYDKDRSLCILRSLKNKKVNIEFSNGVVVNCVDADIVQALKEAGVSVIALAVESGSEYIIRRIINKPLILSKVKPVVEMLRLANIYVRAFFMIGLPGEKKEHRDQTVSFIKDIGFNWVGLMIASPIAGSRLYDICAEREYLNDYDVGKYYFGRAVIKTEDFSPEEIEREHKLINYDVNFVNNYDMRNGCYEIALIGFNDVINRYSGHALAYYCAAFCYKHLGDKSNQKQCIDKLKTLMNLNNGWNEYFEYYNISIEDVSV